MTDRTDRFPPLLARSPARSAKHEHERRLHALAAAIARWLRDAGIADTEALASATLLLPEASRWFDERGAEASSTDVLQLGHRLCALQPALGAHATMFPGALARSLVEQAVDEVAREAQRAGHDGVFTALLPWLYTEPSPTDLAALGLLQGMSPAALGVARARLQRRLRQRLEAGLRLWATSPETRKTLRRQLRESLIGPESVP